MNVFITLLPGLHWEQGGWTLMFRFAGSHQLKILIRKQGKLNKTEWCTVKTSFGHKGCIKNPVYWREIIKRE